MLILYRRTNEEIVLKIPGYEDVRIKVLRLESNSARIGIEAEERIVIMRSELLRDEDLDPDAPVQYQRKPRNDEDRPHYYRPNHRERA